jgi:nodulation protein E
VGRSVAITGMGAVTAAGMGAAALWTAAKNGTTGVKAIPTDGYEQSRVRIAAFASEIDPLTLVTPEIGKTVDRFSVMAIAAADEALVQAGLRDEQFGRDTAVIIGSGIGGAITNDQQSQAFHLHQNRGDPMSIPKIMPSAAASQLSMRYKTMGPAFCVSSACASSAQAIGIGAQMVRSGMVERAIVGGSEAMITPAGMRAWEILRVLTPTFNRPFSKGRDGMTLGEGAAVLMLEDLDAAKARGANILAILAGYGTTSDANDLLKPDPQGSSRAMQLAIDDAGIPADEIGYVNAHGTGTILNDQSETEALGIVFGNRLKEVPVSSTKPIHGHTIGAAGAVELVVTVMALREQILPPTINWLELDPRCDLDAVPNVARPATFGAAMSNSFAFGGINASLVVRAA